MAEHIVNESDAGKRISAWPGDTITIQLPENATTGFQWAIDQLDEQIVSREAFDYELPATPSIGGGGTRRITFKARRSGTTMIKLKLWRSWEGDLSVTKWFEIEVLVSS